MSRWYKRCGADFIHGTMMLTLEEKGAYSLCLDLIYDRGGPIPDDARWLSGVCGVSMRKWNSLRDRLVQLGKLIAREGLLSNTRADFELVSAELQRRNQAEAGAKGGRKRAENEARAKESNDLGQATLKPIEEIRGEKKETPKPPEGGRRGKIPLPDDWQLPSVSDLPPKAKACAEQWTRESYETRGEEFVCFWRSRGRMMKDWRLTWAGRVVDLHSQVMRDQKFGNAPISLSPKVELTAEECLRRAEGFQACGNEDEAQRMRAQAAKLRGGRGPPKAIGNVAGEILRRAG